MNEEKIALMKRLREAALKARNLEALKIEISKDFKKHFGSLEKTVGVFGRDNIMFETSTGKIKSNDMKKDIVKKLTELGFHAFNGDFDDESQLSKIKRVLWNRFGENTGISHDYSRCLAYIPAYGLFLIHPEFGGDMSHVECEEFYRRNANRKMGFGVLIYDKEVEMSCSKLRRLENSNVLLCECNEIGFCKAQENNCLFRKYGKVPDSSLFLFVNDKKSKLAIVQKYEDVIDMFKSAVDS